MRSAICQETGHMTIVELPRPDFMLERLVTHQLPLEQIDDGVRLARAQQALKVLVRPNE